MLDQLAFDLFAIFNEINDKMNKETPLKQIIMSSQTFVRCLEELIKEEDFSRAVFLRLLSQVCSQEEHKQMHLAFYAYYQLVQMRNTKGSLLAIEKGLPISQQSLAVSLLYAIKAALLTIISKHTEALQSLKQSIQIMHVINQKKLTLHPLHVTIFPLFSAKILQAFNFSRGRREFLVLLDEIKGEVQTKVNLIAILSVVNVRMNEIRESMRCAGKSQHEKKLLMSSSSMGMLGSIKTEHEPESTTSIYINRLYEERRKNLGMREKSGFKKSINNPYQLNLHENKESAQCQFM